MTLEKEGKFLTVAPFQCAWRNDFKFKDAGRGCVAFDAFAHNDVTVVFRENVGSQHYHYKRDTSRHYTVILGSHRNRRLKIEVDGKTMVDVEGIGLCCSAEFQSYWISIYDGLISIGTGRYPFQNLVFQWLDSNPNYAIRYVGLSSWDKHVGYQNVNVFPLQQNHVLLWKQVNSREHEKKDDEEEVEDTRMGYEQWGLDNFLENWELSDLIFTVGVDERPVPAHKVILQASGSFPVSPSDSNVIRLQHISYPILHAFLQFIYTGRTQILESQLDSLQSLGIQFQVLPLVKQCEEILDHLKLHKKLFGSGKNVELSCPNTRLYTSFLLGLPLNMQKLKQFQSSGEYSDVNIHIEGYGLLAHAHKVILSLWSVPFTKMFTNGMSESSSMEVYLRDVSAEVFSVMLEFMYSGELNLEDTDGFGASLLELLLLADQFGVVPLYQECCKILLECVSEETVCPILQSVSSIPTCKLIEETCERILAMHFDYCTTASLDFVLLDETTFKNIVKHQDLTVTSEERVLNSILMWCMRAEELCCWEMLDELMVHMTPDQIFKERLLSLSDLLPFIRFPLLPHHVLKKLKLSNLCRQIHSFDTLVKEGILYTESGSTMPGNDQNKRFQHRRSSYKKLQYICDGDSNGVFYFIGTSYGEHQWVNPVLAKKLTITASSPTSRYTDPKVLVSRTYQGMSFAGPRMDDGRTVAWWMVDVGQDHQLMCNYYTLRQDGSRTYIRHWNFQGSMDGRTWTNLSIHENDQTICKPGQFGSWPITGPSALLPFRYFRVILTGPTTDTNNPWSFCICFFELYGYFH